jgi:hypothetical protein
MADQAPPVPRVYRVLQVSLVIVTLLTLWLVAWKVRDAKIEARSAGRERIESDLPPPAGVVPIPRGGGIRAGHFLLRYPERDGVLEVLKPDGEVLAEFGGLRGGERRGWQELQIEVAASNARMHEVRVEYRPGAACRGPGLFRAVKPGLRIEVETLAFSVSRWDPAAGGAVKFDSGSELAVTPSAPASLPVAVLSVQDGALLVK